MFNPDEECENKVLGILWNTNPKISKEFCNQERTDEGDTSTFAPLEILLLCH